MFTSKAKEKLKHYVYLYIDPRSGIPFYVGKGKGNRCFSHLKAKAESAKVNRIDELRKLRLKPRIDILKYGLNEAQALLVEATAIDLLGLKTLTNKVHGHGSKHASRGEVSEIESILDAKKVDIKESAILININRNYRPNMSVHEIYDATRSAWKVGTKRDMAKYALSIHKKVIREVFSIAGWVKGGTTMRSIDKDGRSREREGRWEFIGQVAETAIRKRYIGKSVTDYYKKGAKNPIKYVNC